MHYVVSQGVEPELSEPAQLERPQVTFILFFLAQMNVELPLVDVHYVVSQGLEPELQEQWEQQVTFILFFLAQTNFELPLV